MGRAVAEPDTTLLAWDVAEDEFPTRDVDAQLRFLVRYAVLAPSGHNSQPWRFAVGDGVVELHADRTRRLAAVDPDDRELTIACGAALMTLRLAAAHFGIGVTVDVLPAGPGASCIATVRVAEPVPPSVDDNALFAAVTRRATNRQEYDDRPLPAGLIEQLAADAAAEGGWLVPVVDEAARAAVAGLVSRGDRTQFGDRRFRRELAAWVRPNTSRRLDGIRGSSFGMSDLASRFGPLVIRAFDTGRRQAARDRPLVEAAPGLLVLGTDGDTADSWVAAGQALGRVLLRARAAQVWAGFMNQPIEVTELRPALAATIGRPDGYPQVLLRMGYAPAPRPQPRRSAAEVLATR